eukprot:2268692-Prymnesium_polylepis.2
MRPSPVRAADVGSARRSARCVIRPIQELSHVASNRHDLQLVQSHRLVGRWTGVRCKCVGHGRRGSGRETAHGGVPALAAHGRDVEQHQRHAAGVR